MTPKPSSPAVLAVLALATLTSVVAPTPAAVTFYTQREGSPEDNGHAAFLLALPQHHEEDFEAPEIAMPDGSVPQLIYDDLDLQLTGDWSGAFVPCLAYSPEFVMEGKMFDLALLPGFSLTVTPAEDQAIGGFGLWLFDDGRAYDAAYRMTVVETDGTVSESVLENAIPRDAKGHELEGFIAVVSDLGIASITVAAIDPQTGEPIPDVFEADHIIVARYIPPPPPPPPDLPSTADTAAICGDLDADQDVDLDDYLLFLRALGHKPHSSQYYAPADVDRDGIVSFADFLNWLGCYHDYTGLPLPEVSGERAFKRLFPRHAELWSKHRELQQRLKGGDSSSRPAQAQGEFNARHNRPTIGGKSCPAAHPGFKLVRKGR
jgi:hypothetical protein